MKCSFYEVMHVVKRRIWTTKGFLEIFGYEKTLDLLKPHMRELGHTDGKWLLDKLNLTQGGVSSLQRAESRSYRMPLDRKEISLRLMMRYMDKCRIPSRMRPKPLCKQFEMMMDGVCRKLWIQTLIFVTPR